jgi:hypothetical protein
MVNQYASLLLNLPGQNTPEGVQSYLINHDYRPVNLPVDLSQFYNFLFPADASNYQKQFLCYNYLRLIDSTGLTGDLYKFDKRITYDLNTLTEYFRISQISKPTSSDFNFNINVTGTYTPLAQNNYYYGSFTITQLGYEPAIVIRSDIDGVYINGTDTSPSIVRAIEIPIEYGAGARISQSIPVGNTGISFNIVGPLESFTNTPNKTWNFIAEAPFVFEFNDLFNRLATNYSLVDYVFKYGHETADASNENLWRNHFNSVYRFVGLLNAYVERVNMIYAS